VPEESTFPTLKRLLVGKPIPSHLAHHERLTTRRHYDHVAAQLTLRNYVPQRRVHNTVLIPIGGLQRAVVEALRYAETLSDDVRALYVDVDQSATDQIKRAWQIWGGQTKLIVLASPFRSVMEPLLEYIEQVENERSMTT
jgi:hypothetical protein